MRKSLNIAFSSIIVVTGVAVLGRYGDTVDWVGYLVTAAGYLIIEHRYLKNVNHKTFVRLLILCSLSLEAVYTCDRVSGYPETADHEILINAAIIVFFLSMPFWCIKYGRQQLLTALAATLLFFFPIQRIPGSLLRQYIGYTRTETEMQTAEVVYFTKIVDGRIFAVALVDQVHWATSVFEQSDNESYKHVSTTWMVDGSGSMDAQTPGETWWMIEMDKYFLSLLSGLSTRGRLQS